MITSNSNPAIVEIRKLYDAKHRKETGLFLAEGLKAVGQAFDSGSEVQTVLYSSELLISDYGWQLVQHFHNVKVKTLEVSSTVFENLARKDKPQGIAAVIKQKWNAILDFHCPPKGLLVALNSIQNPGNLGTILRTCDAVGAKGLFLLDFSTDPYDPASVKASMGSIFTIPLVKCESADFLNWVSHNHIPIVGTSDKATQSCFTYQFPSPCVVLMGSEREGLPAILMENTQEMLGIPMEGSADSLNLSVATGIILYQAYLSHHSTRGHSV